MARQQRIPGTESKSIQEVDDAADEYAKQARASVRQRQRTATARDALLEAMKKHKLTVYRSADHDPPIVVTVVPGDDKVKITEDRDDDEADDDEADE